MVLQVNFAKRTDAENTPPSTYPKGLVSRLHSSIHDSSRRRRVRTSGLSHSSKYAIEQAKRRGTNKTKTTAASVRFTVTSVPTPLDVEMDDATRSSSSSYLPAPKSIPISFPRTLGRPEYREVSSEALQAIDPSLVDTDINHIRETLEELGPDLLKSLASVKANPLKDKLPKEFQIVINDLTAIPPTHMLAVFGKQVASKSRQPRRVTLYPVHSLVFTSHCASLPKFPTGLPLALPEEGIRTVDVPVWPLCLPSPATYPHLSTYLYNKRIDLFMKSVLPRPPPPTFEQDPSQLPGFARELAETFTVQTLVKHSLMVFGVWQNVCALGIFDDNLWESLDTLWELLLNSIAIGTGNPSALTTSVD